MKNTLQSYNFFGINHKEIGIFFLFFTLFN